MLTTLQPSETAFLLEAYHSMIGLPGCTWSLDYPAGINITADIDTHRIFALRDPDGSIIATASLEDDEIRDLPFVPDPDLRSIEISRVMVVRSHQGRGIAGVLVAELLDLLRQQGYEAVRLLVNPDNLPAWYTYQKLGFRVIGECDLYDLHWKACELIL